MGRLLQFDENLPFDKQIRFFADEELLDMWLTMQQIEYICESDGHHFPFCEPMLLQELTLRMSRMPDSQRR